MNKKQTFKEKVDNYLKARKKEGLKDMDFYWNSAAIQNNVKKYGKEKSKEAIYEEIWRMINAPDLPDKEVLGKYSI